MEKYKNLWNPGHFTSCNTKATRPRLPLAEEAPCTSQIHKDRGSTNFPKIQEPLKNSRRQKGDMYQVPYCGPTDIWCHRKNFRRHDDMAPRICARLHQTSVVLTPQ